MDREWRSDSQEQGEKEIVISPSRGEVWLADLNPIRGHEQAGRRPVLVISEDLFNHGPADLVIVLPLTSTHRDVPSHVPITPPEGGIKTPSVILCEAIRSIAKERLLQKWGMVSQATIAAIEDRLRILLGL
ncbi:MAG: type II toxin-antitoxin system PemK/MazF family toxin [Candidatus Tectomicrobia bacterium]|nr:type II toxin-antitoxin system PemK/MazF family toxin [Candidatus Tectomicrobia bacterium]